MNEKSCLLLGILSFLAVNVLAETLIVALTQNGKPPLSFPERSSETGIYQDILVAVGSITGDTFVFNYYPPKRIMFLFEYGRVDIEIGINPVWRQFSKVPGNYTVAFAKAEDIILFAPGKKFSVHGAKDLKGMKVGAVRGYYYPGYMEAFAKEEIIRIDGNDEEHLLKRLSIGRGRFR